MDTSPTVIIAPEDRRDALRQPTKEIPITIEHEDCGRHTGVLMDVSRTGVRFRSKFCFPCGSTIVLYPPDTLSLPECWARIMRQSTVEVEGETYFEYGVRFAEETGSGRHAWFLNLRRAA